MGRVGVIPGRVNIVKRNVGIITGVGGPFNLLTALIWLTLSIITPSLPVIRTTLLIAMLPSRLNAHPFRYNAQDGC